MFTFNRPTLVCFLFFSFNEPTFLRKNVWLQQDSNTLKDLLNSFWQGAKLSCLAKSIWAIDESRNQINYLTGDYNTNTTTMKGEHLNWFFQLRDWKKDTHLLSKWKDHCLADLLFDWFRFKQTSKYVVHSSKTAELMQVKQEVSCTLILPLTM